MSKFKKISASKFETSRFYQLPKFLFEDDYFSKMTTEAKVMYALLKDRFELSKINNWIDEENNIYLLYTNKQLCSILQYGEPKIIKLKKELEKFSLIVNERQGLNKPNKIYLLEPNYYKELTNLKFQNKQFVSSRTNKSIVQELTNYKSNETDISETDISETDINDMSDTNDNKNIINDNISHSNHTNHQSTQFNNEALKYHLLQEMPDQLQTYLNNFEVSEIQLIKSVILKAKTSFNNEKNTVYMLEDIEFEMINVLKRFKATLIQKSESVEAMQGYLMRSIKTELEEMHSLNMRRQNAPQNHIFDTSHYL
ncbi:TPA: replication initiator protein A [Staphylococcus aureus]|nr:replication initiator protein A [Staphylococcus aureus]HDE7973615.1 replication initiator protein A [Staphylococcus aureus]HDE8178000.1 replication initiator protein A [Staphylococcus aureus]HDE8718331.1 replication initiator protein A [Staphylococcus aureus]HDE9051614.1 replication initiator protein A [Staphylococcus aureus]